MHRRIITVIVIVPVMTLLSSQEKIGRPPLSAEVILQKNIEAVWGRGIIDPVRHYAFKAGKNSYYVRPDGTMKVLFGLMEPVVVGALLVTPDSAKENLFHELRTLEGTEKTRFMCLARVAGGLFSLTAFRKNLFYEGMKNFGPERSHILSTKIHDLNVVFSIDAETWLLKRMVMKVFTQKEGHFEFIYEFGPPALIQGFQIPSSIFSAPFGTQTSVNPESQMISEVQFNPALGEDFFSNLEINMGEVAAVPGGLRGNVLDVLFFPPRPYFIVVTNWQRGDVDRANLRSGDKLILTLDGIASELIFRVSEAEDGYLDYGTRNARFMTMDPQRGDLYYLFFNLIDRDEAERIKSKLTALRPIKVKKNSFY